MDPFGPMVDNETWALGNDFANGAPDPMFDVKGNMHGLALDAEDLGGRSSNSKRNRGSYKCSKCGQPKKGHVCPLKGKEDGRGELEPNKLFTNNFETSHDLPLFTTTGDVGEDDDFLLPPNMARHDLPMGPGPVQMPATPIPFTDRKDKGLIGMTASSASQVMIKRDGSSSADTCLESVDMPRTRHVAQTMRMRDRSLDTCMMLVFSKLPPDSLAVAGAACRRWHAASREVWEHSREMTLTITETHTEDYVSTVTSPTRCPQLQHLTVNVCTAVGDAMLFKMAKEPRAALRTLRVRVAPGASSTITSAGLQALLGSAPGLARIELGGCGALQALEVESVALETLHVYGACGLQTLRLQCPALAELCLNLIEGERAALPEAALHPQGPSTPPLDVQATTELALMRMVAEQCPGLSRVHVAAPGLTDPCVRALLSNETSSLRAVSITHAAGLSDDAVQEVASSCERLEVVDLSGCTAITDKSLGHLASAFGGSLAALHVAACPRLTRAGVEGAVGRFMKLQTLDCGHALVAAPKARAGAGAGAGALEALAKGQDKLGPFSGGAGALVAPVSELRRGAVDGLEIRSASLQRLSLWGCTRVQGLVLDCPQLVDINVSCCDTLAAGRVQLGSCPGLKEVHAEGCAPAFVKSLRATKRQRVSGGAVPTGISILA